MAKYRVWMTVTGTASFEIEASSPEEAMQKANDEHAESTVSICHQCSGEISEPTIVEAVDAALLD